MFTRPQDVTQNDIIALAIAQVAQPPYSLTIRSAECSVRQEPTAKNLQDSGGMFTVPDVNWVWHVTIHPKHPPRPELREILLTIEYFSSDISVTWMHP